MTHHGALVPQQPVADRPPVISAQNISRHFELRRSWLDRNPARIIAVDDVSFDVPHGSCFAIVGESGSGKSTLARVLVGLLRPSHGDVLLLGRSMSALGPREARAMRRHVQLVLQDPRASLDPKMRVADVLREALIVHGLHPGKASRQRRIEEVVRQVGLGRHHLDRYPNELSGGQRQRVAIARAIICEPEILVLDEPVSALDVSVQAQIINLLIDLQEELGLTYVMITHDLSLVGHMADQVGVMYLGRFVESGPASRICSDPRHPYTASLLAAVPDDRIGEAREDDAIALEGSVPSPQNRPGGCSFHTRCPKARLMATGRLRDLRWSGRTARSTEGHELPRRCVEDPPGASPRASPDLPPLDWQAACHFPLGPRPGAKPSRTAVPST